MPEVRGGPEVAETPLVAVPTSDAPAPSLEAPPTDQPEAPPPDQPTETPVVAPPGTPGLETAQTIPTPTFVAPTGDPFTLKVDRSQVPIEGAVQTPDGGVYFSPDAYRRFQHNYVGDRHAWAQERRSLMAQSQQTTAQITAKQEQLDASLATIDKLFSDPDFAIQQLQNWQQNGPLLQLQAKLAATSKENERLAQAEQARAQAEEEATLVPQMQRWLFDEAAAIVETDYKELFDSTTGVALLHELWAEAQQSGRFFYKDPRDGKIHLDRDGMRREVDRQAEWVRRARQGMQKVAAVKAVNQAVLTPTKPGPAAPAKAPAPKVSRDESGKFTTRPDPEEWEKSFRAKRYSTT